jgi:hypothetical protein
VKSDSDVWLENVLWTNGRKKTPESVYLHSLRIDSSLTGTTEQNIIGTLSVIAVLMVTKFASKMKWYASLELTARKTQVCAPQIHNVTSLLAIPD